MQVTRNGASVCVVVIIVVIIIGIFITILVIGVVVVIIISVTTIALTTALPLLDPTLLCQIHCTPLLFHFFRCSWQEVADNIKWNRNRPCKIRMSFLH